MAKTSAVGKTSDILNIDYASVEARVLAHYGKDEYMEKNSLLDAFTDFSMRLLARGMPPASGLKRRKGSKPTKNRIIKTFTRDGRRWELHATKGWRNYRA